MVMIMAAVSAPSMELSGSVSISSVRAKRVARAWDWGRGQAQLVGSRTDVYSGTSTVSWTADEGGAAARSTAAELGQGPPRRLVVGGALPGLDGPRSSTHGK